MRGMRSKKMLNLKSKKLNWGFSLQTRRGFSLIEMLVVVLTFSILAVLSTQALVHSLRGSRKSEAITQVRENADYAMGIMVRLLRSAGSITCSADNKRVDYVDEEGVTARFSCLPSGSTAGYIASGSSDLRLTSSDVYVNCTGIVFVCVTPTPPASSSVTISIVAQDADLAQVEGAQVTITSKVILRNY